MCDNWREISLLDVAGKVFACVIQTRLQAIADSILPESQCGFWKGRGCTDIFVARQLVEKCHEHNDALFVLFVDLKRPMIRYQGPPSGVCWSDMGSHLQCYPSSRHSTVVCRQKSELVTLPQRRTLLAMA